MKQALPRKGGVKLEAGGYCFTSFSFILLNPLQLNYCFYRQSIEGKSRTQKAGS
ncbi:hypothetical protein HMPREF0083_04332 [Aneurinibacillus aneurinilyticus ATCC 12856]|uniref:Uncharacterized protein n=1 Tax=Aneurinibacillus aneurinilyticus ATCC 12856 TaxID=649747 RepID=U1WG87_ANEAE|nr:hypothetical protein HMPREF0083_04332 [Aneurinibacillus aneurinilyticus ATCC 12856]